LTTFKGKMQYAKGIHDKEAYDIDKNSCNFINCIAKLIYEKKKKYYTMFDR